MPPLWLATKRGFAREVLEAVAAETEIAAREAPDDRQERGDDARVARVESIRVERHASHRRSADRDRIVGAPRDHAAPATPWIFGRVCAPIYDGITAEEPWRCHCRAMIGAVPGPRVLDLGIGPGVSGIEMARAAPGARIAGVDCSAAMLRRARRHVAAADLVLPLVRADAARLPFRDAAWDGVTAHSFLYLLPDGARVLREAHRVLRPDGGIALLEPSDLWGRPRLRAVTAAFRHGVRFGIAMLLWSVFSALHGRYSPVRLASELRFAGFVDVRVTRAFDGLGLLATARRP